jgi:hypothetical protein
MIERYIKGELTLKGIDELWIGFLQLLFVNNDRFQDNLNIIITRMNSEINDGQVQER